MKCKCNKWKPLDTTLSITGNLESSFNVDSGFSVSLFVSDHIIPVTITTNKEDLPLDEDCLPLDVDLTVSQNCELIDFEVSDKKQLQVDLTVIDNKLDVEISLIWLKPYLGPYIVEPRKVMQILDTHSRSMTEDVQINPIYYSEVVNLSGGNTVVIGKE